MNKSLSPAGDASIRVVNLTKRYGEFLALDGIDLEISSGEFLTLLGPSGSGKTTILNILAGFTKPSSGEVFIDGVPVQTLPPYKRNVGVVFQNYALFPHMTVRQNVNYPLQQRGFRKSERSLIVQTALERVGLTEFDKSLPKHLSGGQQQRVALARAIVYDPPVLLMDEPLGALDKKLRESLQLEIKRIHAELGRTFIFVTHDQDEALVLSDRIAVINKGRIEQIGSPRELYEQPQSLFTATFLGDSTILRGEVAKVQSGSCIFITCGTSVRARCSPDMMRGHAVAVIRPERLHLCAIDNRPPSSNAIRGVVQQELYLGSTRRIEIRVDDAGPVIIRESAVQSSPCKVGEEAWVTFDSDDITVLSR